MEQTELILEIVGEACSSADKIFGSALGTLIRAKLPLVNLRDDYGGLRKFLQSECSHILKFSHKQGGDDVFTVINGNEGHLTSEPSTVWRTFSNPIVNNGRLFYDNANTRLLVGAKRSTTQVGNLVPIEGISHVEQKEVIREFAEKNLDQEEQNLVERSLASENYWQLSTSVFQSSEPSRSKEFIEFRKDKLHEILRARLVTAGASESQAMMTSNWLRKGRPAIRVPEDNARATASRESIVNLVLKMTEAELDQVRIPLSIVAEIVERNSR